MSQDPNLQRWALDAYDTPPRESHSRLGCRDELLAFGWIILGVLILTGITWVLLRTGAMHCLPMVSCS